MRLDKSKPIFFTLCRHSSYLVIHRHRKTIVDQFPQLIHTKRTSNNYWIHFHCHHFWYRTIIFPHRCLWILSIKLLEDFCYQIVRDISFFTTTICHIESVVWFVRPASFPHCRGHPHEDLLHSQVWISDTSDTVESLGPFKTDTLALPSITYYPFSVPSHTIGLPR